MTKPGDIIATIDIGSNAIRYRAFAYSVGLKPVELDRARYPVQLGASCFDGGRLSDADLEQAVTALKVISRSALGAGAARVVAVATSAVREAANAGDFIDRARAEAGVEVRVISAAEEARLAALGASCGGSNAGNAYMIDIGGGSTEVVAIDRGAAVRWDVSLPLGAVRLARAWMLNGRPDSARLRVHREDVARIIAEGVPHGTVGISSDASEAWALGGTPGALEQMLRSDAFKKLHPKQEVSPDRMISRELFEELYVEIAAHSAEELHEKFGVDARRAPLLLPGAVILRAILDHLKLPRFVPCDAGVCEGLAWQAQLAC